MVCKKCELDKTEEEYYYWDRYKCKECRRKIDRERYPKRKKYLRNYWIEWYSKSNNKKRHYKNSKDYAIAWQKKHPRVYEAISILRKEIRRGKIIRPDVCEICKTKTKIEGHHPDYNKPLYVLWLCRSCHKKEHLRLLKTLADIQYNLIYD